LIDPAEIEPTLATTRHVPVLLNETLDLLRPQSGGRYVDGTLGGAGHAAAILERSSPDGRLLGIDRDPEAIERARERLADFGARAIVVNDSFSNLERDVRWEGFAPVDGVLLDLGLSSDQLAEGGRGFSFRSDAPLDMRFNPNEAVPSARDLVNSLDAEQLTTILFRFGEESHARAIARAIVASRSRKPIQTANELATLVERVVPRRGSTHPATRTFQALRIAVNHELEAIEAAIPQAIEVLAPGGRLAVITFHSLEDRLIKRTFADLAATCVCPPGLPICVCGRTPKVRLLTRHGIRPASAEVAANPRSRSATLRGVEKLPDPAADLR
jgi:16S rRNA (cytosine1402-N4)-methyltransferase